MKKKIAMYYVNHTHRFGNDFYIFQALDSTPIPSQEEVINLLNIDVEPELGEDIEIYYIMPSEVIPWFGPKKEK